MALTLMKGSEAIAEAAIRAGARFFFGYPITPQTEIPEYMSARMPEVGGCFLQAESEVAAINMVYGAAGTGARVITPRQHPGLPGRLFPGRQGRRQRRLPSADLRPLLRAGSHRHHDVRL